ncbi:SLAM family member 5-like isoform 2-T2 [Spinachia spinachia]
MFLRQTKTKSQKEPTKGHEQMEETVTLLEWQQGRDEDKRKTKRVVFIGNHWFKEPPDVTPVFVLKGRDLLLKLGADLPEKFSFVEWKFNKTVSLVRIDAAGETNIFDHFPGRLEIPEKEFSVVLKNVQEADSGVYSAEAPTLAGDNRLAEYKVTVQGPVSPVELTVDRVDSNSSGSGDLNVTCRTHNSHISSTFSVDRVCSQEGGERSEVTTSGASLQLYLLNDIIICNHSNQVNWIHNFITAEHLCSSNTDSPLPVGWVTAIILIAVGFVGVFAWRCYRRKRRILDPGMIVNNTVYEVPQELTPAPPQNENCIYSLVTLPAASPQPESAYAKVEKPARSAND